MIGRVKQPPVTETARPMGFDDFDLRLGDVMRGERATLGKSLLDVQRELKIKANYIAAIENADPDAFETQGFVAGYVRSYAQYLGLDPEWAFKRFCAEGNFVTAHGMSPAASASRDAASTKRAKQRKDPLADPNALFVPRAEALISRIEPGAVGSSLVLLMLISVIGYGGWSVFEAVQRVQLAPVDQTPGVTSQIGSMSPGADVVAAMANNSGIEAPSMDVLDRIYRPEALEIPVIVARDGPIARLDPLSVGNLGGADLSELEGEPELVIADQTPAAPQVLATDRNEVVVFAVRPSWVRVQSADGTVVFEKILDAGERYVLPSTEESPFLRAGNAGSVYFAVNGQTYGPAGNGPSVVKNVALGVEELQTAYQVADVANDIDLARFVAQAPVSE